MNLLAYPPALRPREKLITNGPQHLSDAEILALILGTGEPGKNVVTLATELIAKFGSLQKILAASISEVCTLSGIGPSKYARLQASRELVCRAIHEPMQEQPAFPSSAATKQYLLSKMLTFEREVFALLLLNSQNVMVGFEMLFRGTLTRAPVYPREIIKTVLNYNANAVILAHNHPSGNSEPSASDIAMTKRLSKILETIDVPVLDHIVVGKGHCTSMAELGLLA